MLAGRMRQSMSRKGKLKRFYAPSFSSRTLTTPTAPNTHTHTHSSLVISQGHVLCILRNYLAKVLLLKASPPGSAVSF